MIYYVCGFMFCNHHLKDRGRFVLLVRKARPAWQSGKYNGVGGHVEKSDLTPRQAMVREFKEETGIKTNEAEWTPFVRLSGKDWTVEFFKYFTDVLHETKTDTDEPTRWFHLGRDNWPMVSLTNLSWLIPLALDTNDGKGKIDYLIEFIPWGSQ